MKGAAVEILKDNVFVRENVLWSVSVCAAARVLRLGEEPIKVQFTDFVSFEVVVDVVKSCGCDWRRLRNV